jgi:chemotaxis protein MotB
MSDESVVIIRKKCRKKHGGGHHGGAWKVAYADFVTAMMAFFLVLWLLAAMSPEDKAGMAEYFESYTLFEGSGGGQGVAVMPGGALGVTPIESQIGVVRSAPRGSTVLVFEFGKMVETDLAGFQDQILISASKDGVRLELMESEKIPIFEAGKAVLLPNGIEIFEVLARSLKSLPNNITIEGHTDSAPHPSKTYSNWELAADRANAARRELVKNGFSESRIASVISFADRIPIDSEYPRNPFNRRVSIVVRDMDRMSGTRRPGDLSMSP